MASVIMARATANFPGDLATARKMLEAVDADIAAQGAALQAEAERRGSSFRWPKAFAELQARRERLQAHVTRLQSEADAAKLIQAAAEPQRAPRPEPAHIDLPPRPKSLVKAEKAADEARAKVDEADAALRAFAAKAHPDQMVAGREGFKLTGARQAAQATLKTALAELAAEKRPWHEACSGLLEIEFARRRVEAMELVAKLDDLLLPLLDAGRRALLDTRRLDTVRGIAQQVRQLKRALHHAAS